MTQDQEDSLLNGGDCFKHWHSADRQPTHAFLEGLQGAAKVVTKTSSYDANLSDDYVLCDTTSGVMIVTLPVARGNKLTTFVKTLSANKVTFTPTSPDTINGSASLDITSNYTPVRLLAVQGVGYIQV